jgi:hypothetical protein
MNRILEVNVGDLGGTEVGVLKGMAARHNGGLPEEAIGLCFR